MTGQSLPQCPCSPSEDVHQDTCPHYLELLRREQAWRNGQRPVAPNPNRRDST